MKMLPPQYILMLLGHGVYSDIPTTEALSKEVRRLMISAKADVSINYLAERIKRGEFNEAELLVDGEED